MTGTRVNRTCNLCLLGFGNVGRALVELLIEKRDALVSEHGIAWRITGVATRRMGWLASADGLDSQVLLEGRVSAAKGAPTNIKDWLLAARVPHVCAVLLGANVG